MRLQILSTSGSLEAAARMLASANIHRLSVRLEVCRMGSPHGGDTQGAWPVEQWLPTMDCEYVLMADSYDVLFLAGEEEILDKFASFENDFVMSAENYCMTEHLDIPRIFTSWTKPGSHPYPNCGLWIGKRKRAIELLKQSIDLYRKTPRYPEYALDGVGAWFTYGLLDGTMDFALDRNSVLFQSMGGPITNTFPVVKDGRIFNTVTQEWPIAIHYNGSCNDHSEYHKMANTLYGIPL